MKTKRLLSVIMVWCFVLLQFQSIAAVAGMTDITGHWAQEITQKWINNELIAGYPDGQFKPDNEITRAEFVTLVNRAFKIQTGKDTYSFTDVESFDWFYGQVASGRTAGYISGYPDGTFKPNSMITRQEAAAMIAKLLGLTPGDEKGLIFFDDYQTITPWAKPSVNGVLVKGIMNGFPDKTFRPMNNITRAETVVTLERSLAYFKDRPLKIKGIVKMSNQPVKGANVRAFHKDSREVFKSTVSGEDGGFTLEVPEGQYEITAVYDINVGYTGLITVSKNSLTANQEISLDKGAKISGTLLDSAGNPAADLPLAFTTNPSFIGSTQNNGAFSIVVPLKGIHGEALFYSGFYFYENAWETFISHQQFSGDIDLGQVRTKIPGRTSGGSGGGNNSGGSSVDKTAPIWSPGFPKASDVTVSGFNLLMKANEGGTNYYVVLADGAVVPTAAEVKNGTGSGGIAAIKTGSVTSRSNEEISVSITGLTAGTAYDLYVIAEDTLKNLQASPVKIEVTTASQPGDVTPPALNSASVNGSTLVMTFTERLDENSKPQGGDFSVKVDGTVQAAPVNVAMSNENVTITLAKAVEFMNTVTVSYIPGLNPIRDIAGNKAAAFTDQAAVNRTGELVAPPVDRTVATNFFDSTAFLYSGNNAVQTGIDPAVIEEKRVAVLRGKVLSSAGTPLPGVQITIPDHPEIGSTISRQDGWFDMAVNGGSLMTVRYEKSNLITVQRQVDVPWQEFVLLPDVVLIAYDSKATKVDLSADTMQVARGSVVTDTDGSRQATILLPKGVQAEMQMPDGTSSPLSTLTVRATEYTAGENGPQAMPGELPANVAYTYCVEYSVDEAVKAGAKSVRFDQPIYHYVENFIGFPVGGIVPVGYYDYDRAAWIPSENGRVIKILSTNEGIANLDIDGSGLPADNNALGSLSVTDEERRKLAALYQPGQTLWRVPVTHFTPIDCNWPFLPPLDAKAPEVQMPEINDVTDPCIGSGSIIEYQNQTLGETAMVYGTSFSLNYNSRLAKGYKQSRSIEIPLSGDNLPGSLKEIRLEVNAAGQRLMKSFGPDRNQSYTYTWDGKDAYGRIIQGSTPVSVRLGYVYEGSYREPADFFGTFGGKEYDVSRDALNYIFWKKWSGTFSSWDSQTAGIGGWSLDVHHSYDPSSGMLYFGDGSRQETDTQKIISTVAGNGDAAYSGDNDLASKAQMNRPFGVAAGPDGSIYIADGFNYRIRKISPEGMITTVAGTGTSGNLIDNGPARMVRINAPMGIALGPDGSIYFSEFTTHRIRKVSPDGFISVVTGTGNYGFSGDGGLAAEAKFYSPEGIAVAPDGSIYIADAGNHRIRRIAPNGIITTIAGNGDALNGINGGYSGDGGQASGAKLNYPMDVAIGHDGSIYIADSFNNRIRKIDPSGIISTVAGNGTDTYSGDGGLAVLAGINNPNGIEVDQDGTLYISDYRNHCIRKVTPDGIISTLAGNGTAGYSGDGGQTTEARLNYPSDIALRPDGSLYIADTYNHRIRQVGRPSLGIQASDLVIPDENGNELYVFDWKGRHKNTINALTGSIIYTFAYNEQGGLLEVKDAFGNAARIERDGQGNPTAIIASGGQKTYLEVNRNGYLSKISCPYKIAIDLEYTEDNLLTMFSDHKGNQYHFTYDKFGRLTMDQNPVGGYTKLSRTKLGNGYEVRVENAGGQVSTYRAESLSGIGIRRVDTDQAGGITNSEIYNDGRKKVTYPDGTVATMNVGPDPRQGMSMFSPVTREVTITTPGGLTSRTTRERTVELTDPGDIFSITRMTDRVTKNGELYTSILDIDMVNRRITMTNATPEGRETVSTLDWYGRLIKEEAPGLEPTSYSYDAKGHLTKVQQGNRSVTYAYDSMNRMTAFTDAVGDTFRYTYNDADILKSITMPGGEIYHFTNDANGNTTGITMPSGAIHQLGYTAIDLEQSYTPPDNGSYLKTYALNRELTGMKLPDGREVFYEYDRSGRIIGTNYGAKDALSYRYSDATNRVAGINRTHDGIDYHYTYDGSLITRMTATVSDAVYSSVYGSSYGYSYRYDNLFKLTGITQTGKPEVALEYDRDGLLTRYGPFTITHAGPLGAPSQISDGIMSGTYTYDNYGRPINRTHTVKGKQIYLSEAVYDNAGIIRERTETVSGSVYRYSYTYDQNKQLTEVQRNGRVVEAYTYDVNGNRLTYGAQYDAQDRLTKLGNGVYRYDAAGFLTQRSEDTFTYTAQGELRQVIAGGKSISYTYDGLGRRVGRSLNTGTAGAPVIHKELYLYGNLSSPFQVTALISSSGTESRYYYDENNFLMAIQQGADWYYVATDHLGTPRVISNAEGIVIKVMEYDSYGKLIFDSNPGFYLLIGYAGGIADPDNKLVHFGLRDYDPEAGRWTARDPIFFNGKQGNLYVYVGNNPVNLHDPTGLFCIGATAYGGVGGGGQLCITGKGVSVCAEVGFGVGTSVEVQPMGDLARTGSEVGISGGIKYAEVGPGLELVLDDCGSLKFTGGIGIGPFSQSASYDFLDEKWSLSPTAIGGGNDKMLNTISQFKNFSPKFGVSAKVYGRKCLQF